MVSTCQDPHPPPPCWALSWEAHRWQAAEPMFHPGSLRSAFHVMRMCAGACTHASVSSSAGVRYPRVTQDCWEGQAIIYCEVPGPCSRLPLSSLSSSLTSTLLCAFDPLRALSLVSTLSRGKGRAGRPRTDACETHIDLPTLRPRWTQWSWP